ncbi:uncharacterized protein LOC135343564 isoform X2 [Halichondria panicea]|uniref:uncharacterized protein LOC135343564 isoform X2 n=1 Tax=Halichondria panicea TaxID=6063 RepID=UPI00312B7EEA
MKLLVLLTACVLCYGQQPVIEPVLVVGRAGEIVTITCIVGDSEPNSIIILTDNSQQLMTNTQDLQTDRVVYTYGPLVPGDEGRMVICQYGVEQASGSISVLFPPQYSVVDITHDVMEGSGYRVTLGVAANPIPTNQETTVTFNGGPLGDRVTVTFNTLEFTNINRVQSGVYAVSSTTSAGTSTPDNFNIIINVLYPPMFTAEPSTGITCTGTTSPYTCVLLEGAGGTLNCATMGNPQPTLTINSPVSEQISANNITGLVTFSSATSGGNGAMVDCTATNGDVTVSRSFTVYVGRGPAQPTNVTATISGSILIVSWTYSDPDNVNIPLVQFSYIIAATGGSTVVRNGTAGPSERSFTVDLSELEENTQYNVELRAENLLGSTPAVSQFTTVTDMKMLDDLLSMESIIGLVIGIPAIIIVITLVVILLVLLLVKSRKKGAYTTDPVIYDTVEDNSSPGPVVISVNAAYGLAEENTGAYTTDPAISNNPAYGLTKEKTSSANEEYIYEIVI